ncbi:XRE family transcriptional regulator [Kitasatospora sp. NPDC056783]|uniref:XRE family transcriptional regulator n=1 Tax=Kitasatospora sp. NPDC056783 TaxID=3345943 RepID=UPI00369FBC78
MVDHASDMAFGRQLKQSGLSYSELAEEMNGKLEELTGKRGTFSDRTVYNLVHGKTTRPQGRTCLALEAVFECPTEDLGFTPPATYRSASNLEDHVQRRTLLTTAPLAAVAAVGATGSTRYRVGSADVDQLDLELARLIASDNHAGGTVETEQRASRLVQRALDLQQRGSVGQRTRSRLYTAAALFASSAMWAAIDGRRLGSAEVHLNQAVTLAGLSNDPATQLRCWGFAGVLYSHMGRTSDSKAAREVARSTGIVRQDPFYASLTHARMATHHASVGDVTAMGRSLGYARDAFGRIDMTCSRPTWTAFYDEAELELLSATAAFEAGLWAEAEAHAHRNLSLLRPSMQRNRSLTLTYLANAQLRQDEIEAAVATARMIPTSASRGRTGHLLDRFTATIAKVAPGSPHAQDWIDHRREAHA